MECLYNNELSDNCKELIFSDYESRHIKSLRLKENELVLVTNGKYLSSTGTVFRTSKRQFAFIPQEFHYKLNEPNIKVTLAIGILNNNDRFEFALEKAVELGVSEIVPLITKHTEQSKIRRERLEQKAIAAMKQCKRSFLPRIMPVLELSEFITSFGDYDSVILADEKGGKPQIDAIKSTCCIIVGPEGGFSNDEITLLTAQNLIKWNLGKRRLRAETASTAAISQLIAIL